MSMLPHELKLWSLRQMDLFQKLPEQALMELDRMSVMKEFPPRTEIPLERSDVVYLIKEGHLEVGTRTPEGREMILELLGPHDFFGVLTVSAASHPFLRSVEPTRVCILRKQDFLDFIRRHPEAALRAFERQTLRIRDLEARLESLALENTRKRLARVLATLAGKFPEGVIPLTHQEIAAMAGCARETASAILSEFQKEGWIQTGKGKIRVLAPEILNRFGDDT